jgi:hypothetical protein
MNYMCRNFALNRISLVVTLAVLSASVKAESNIALRSIEESFAVATLMSDSEALTFGFTNFDLNVNDPGFGDETTAELKNSLTVFVIPYTWELDSEGFSWDHALTARAFYINSERDSELFPDVTDTLKQNTVGVYGSYSQYFRISDSWYVSSAFGLHLTYYDNSYDYGDGFPEASQQELDGSAFNITSLALIGEPQVGIGFTRDEDWGSWRAHNNINYIYGQGFGGSVDKPFNINPEGWRITNGVEFTVSVPDLWGVDDFLTIDLKRIDLYGDLASLADNGYYYETSFGWVIDTNNKIPLLDNIGIGISINYGSSISGATIVLYWNE